MAVTITVDRVDFSGKSAIVEGRLSVAGNYVTGGDTVDFSAKSEIPSNLGPTGLVELEEQPASGASPSGFQFYLIAGSAMNNWLLFFATAVGQPPTQLGAGAYPAALLAATFQFRAYFNYGF